MMIQRISFKRRLPTAQKTVIQQQLVILYSSRMETVMAPLGPVFLALGSPKKTPHIKPAYKCQDRDKYRSVLVTCFNPAENP